MKKVLNIAKRKLVQKAWQSLHIEQKLRLNSLEEQTAMSSEINVVEEEKELKQPNDRINNQKQKFDSKYNQTNRIKKEVYM